MDAEFEAMKLEVLKKIDDLRNKVEAEKPFHDCDELDTDFLCDVSDELDNILSSWYY